MSMLKKNTIDFLSPEKDLKKPIENCQFVVLPFPLEYSTSYIQGTRKGPQAILEASSQIEYFDPELQQSPLDHGIYTDHSLVQNALSETGATIKPLLRQASDLVQQYLDHDKFVLTLGGEHTITAGVAQPFLRKFQENITIIHIDAHADLKNMYEGSSYSHACAIRRIVNKSPILSIGIRSLDQNEYDFAKQSPLITTFFDHELDHAEQWIEKAIACISTPFIYLTLDVDGLDPSIMPATGTPQPGGLKWKETLTFLKKICQTHKLVGADVNELCPIPAHHAASFLAAKLCYKIMGYSLL